MLYSIKESYVDRLKETRTDTDNKGNVLREDRGCFAVNLPSSKSSVRYEAKLSL